MRSARVSLFLLLLAATGFAQVNKIRPNEQINWPTACIGAYVPATNTCVLPGTAANPAGSTGQGQYNAGGFFGAINDTNTNGGLQYRFGPYPTTGQEGFASHARGGTYGRPPLGMSKVIDKAAQGQFPIIIGTEGTSIEVNQREGVAGALIAMFGKSTAKYYDDFYNYSLGDLYSTLGPAGWVFERSHGVGQGRIVGGASTSNNVACGGMNSGPISLTTPIGVGYAIFIYDQEPYGGTTSQPTVNGANYGPTISYKNPTTPATSTYGNQYYISLDPTRQNVIKIPAPTDGCGFHTARFAGPNLNDTKPGAVLVSNELSGSALQHLTGRQTDIYSASFTTGSGMTGAPGACSFTIASNLSGKIATGMNLILDHDTNPQKMEQINNPTVSGSTVTGTCLNAHSGTFSVQPFLQGLDSNLNPGTNNTTILLSTVPGSTTTQSDCATTSGAGCNGGLTSWITPPQDAAHDPLLAPDIIVNYHATNDVSAFGNSVCTGGTFSGATCYGTSTPFRAWSAGMICTYYGDSWSIDALASDGKNHVFACEPPFGTARTATTGTAGGTLPTFTVSTIPGTVTTDGTISWVDEGLDTAISTYANAQYLLVHQAINQSIPTVLATEEANYQCFGNTTGLNWGTYSVGGEACSQRFEAVLQVLNSTYTPPYVMAGASGIWNTADGTTPSSRPLDVSGVISLLDLDWLRQPGYYGAADHQESSVGNVHPRDYNFGDPHRIYTLEAAKALGLPTPLAANPTISEDARPSFSRRPIGQNQEPLCSPPGTEWTDTTYPWPVLKLKYSNYARPTQTNGGCDGGFWQIVYGRNKQLTGSLQEEFAGLSLPAPYSTTLTADNYDSGTQDNIDLLPGINPALINLGRRTWEPGHTYTISVTAFAGIGGTMQFRLFGLYSGLGTLANAWDFQLGAFNPALQISGADSSGPFTWSYGGSNASALTEDGENGAAPTDPSVENRQSFTFTTPTGAAAAAFNGGVGTIISAQTAGSGYSAGSYTCTVNGGTFTVQATCTSVFNGTGLTWQITNPGTYTVVPTSITTTATTGGTPSTVTPALASTYVLPTGNSWAANTAYTAGTYITVDVAGVFINYMALNSGTSNNGAAPNWAGCTVNCQVTESGGTPIVWLNAGTVSQAGYFFDIPVVFTKTSVPTWGSNTAAGPNLPANSVAGPSTQQYVLSSVAATGQPYIFQTSAYCTVGSSEPAWVITRIGSLTQDNTCSWKNLGPYYAATIRDFSICEGSSSCTTQQEKYRRLSGWDISQPNTTSAAVGFKQGQQVTESWNGTTITHEAVNEDGGYARMISDSGTNSTFKLVGGGAGGPIFSTWSCQGSSPNPGDSANSGTASLITQTGVQGNIAANFCQFDGNTMGATSGDFSIYSPSVTLTSSVAYTMSFKYTVGNSPWVAGNTYAAGSTIMVQQGSSKYVYVTSAGLTAGATIPNFATCTTFYPTPCTISDNGGTWTITDSNSKQSGAGPAKLMLMWKVGGTIYYLQQDGTWTTSVNLVSIALPRNTYGQPVAILFTSPTVGQGATGVFYLRAVGGKFTMTGISDWVIEPGSYVDEGIMPGLNAANTLTTAGGQTISAANTLSGLPAGCQQVPCKVAAADPAAQTAAMGVTTLFTTPASAGRYRLNAYLRVNTTTETAGTITVTMCYTYLAASVCHAPIAAFSATAVNDNGANTGSMYFPADASTNITYQVAFSGVTGGAISYTPSFDLELAH